MDQETALKGNSLASYWDMGLHDSDVKLLDECVLIAEEVDKCGVFAAK